MNCQQYELYGAETSVSALTARITPRELQSWVDDLRDLPFWQRNFSHVLRVETLVRKSDREGSVGGFFPVHNAGFIEMAPCHLTELYVLHEVSHVLASARFKSRSHDPWFSGTYLRLVSERLGPEIYRRLADEMDAAGVDHDSGQNFVPAGRIQL